MVSDGEARSPLHISDIIISICVSFFAFVGTVCGYRIFLHPLAGVPGPLLAKCTSLYHLYHSYMGDECTAANDLHRKYGPIIRLAPDLIDISSGAALSPIYLNKEFLKPASYHNAYTDGFATMFSTTDLGFRAGRAKAVAPLFARAAVERDKGLLYGCVERFVRRLERFTKGESKGRPVDVQEHTRALGMDVLASYLFRHRPPHMQEEINKGTMIPWLDIIVDAGRFFHFPSRFFRFCVWAYLMARPEKDRWVGSVEMVRGYAMSVACEGEEKRDGTFQGRLTELGISKEEIAAECKSMMVAGIHSSGSVLAHILWLLVKNPNIYERLRQEILANQGKENDVQQLPYLHSVINEGFRLAPANAARLPRVVPSSGWHFDGHYFPPGTIVGIAPPQLFFNPDVYPDPTRFWPERWANASVEMKRDLVPFSVGIRRCIAKNLATAELYMAVEKIVESDILRGAKVVQDKVEVWEWFNVAVKGNKIELIWE